MKFLVSRTSQGAVSKHSPCKGAVRKKTGVQGLAR